MLSADDARWGLLNGGYGTRFDPRPVIERLRGLDAQSAWAELWGELHHQGDLGDASYVAVVLLSELQRTSPLNLTHLFAFCSTVEVERRRVSNPPIPPWLEPEYRSALAALRELALTTLRQNRDREESRAALAIVALAGGDVQVGALIWHQSDDTLLEYLNERLYWSVLYRNNAS